MSGGVASPPVMSPDYLPMDSILQVRYFIFTILTELIAWLKLEYSDQNGFASSNVDTIRLQR